VFNSIADPKLRTGAISGVAGRGIETTRSAGAVQVLDADPVRGVAPESIGFSRLGPDAKVVDSVTISKQSSERFQHFAANDDAPMKEPGTALKNLSPRSDAYGAGRRSAAIPGGRPLGVPALGQPMSESMMGGSAHRAAAARPKPIDPPTFEAPDRAPQLPAMERTEGGSAPNIDATRRVPGDPDGTLFRLKGVRSSLIGKAQPSGGDRATLADASMGIAGAQAEVVRGRQEAQADEMKVGLRRLRDAMEEARPDYRYRPEPVKVSFDSFSGRRDTELNARAKEPVQVPGARRDTPADFLVGSNIAPAFTLLGPGVAAAEAYAASETPELL
jgi:hypothetical protein